MSARSVQKKGKPNGRISLVNTLIKNGAVAEKFEWDDVAQQIFGAILFSAPFTVTEEVWRIAKSIDEFRLFSIFLFTVFSAAIIIYYTQFQKVAKESIGGEFDTIIGKTYIPKRLVSLLVVSYGTAFFVLWVFGIIGIEILDIIWATKLVVVVSFFASIGAATADVMK